MKRGVLSSGSSIAIALALSGTAHAQSTQDLQRMLDEAAKTIQDLKSASRRWSATNRLHRRRQPHRLPRLLHLQLLRRARLW